MVDMHLIKDDLLCPSNPHMVRLRASDQRATVGFLTANIHMGVSRTLWRGVVDAAEKHDVNLICFPGGAVHVSQGFESQRNVVYDQVTPARLHGLVSWSSTVGGMLSPTGIMDFHRRYQPLPMVSLTQFMAGIPTVLVDSYQGMRAAIVHLIEVHGYRRLAFIRGPESHYYAQERYRAYTDVLQEYGIPFVPELVTSPLPFQMEAGENAIQMLVDEAGLRPKVNIQAVVAVSDLLALGALKALQARGIQVPKDMAIVGFNDSMEGQLATPPLTSVSLPFYEQGRWSIETLLAQLSGKDVPEQIMLESKLVVRQSCACRSKSVVQAAARPVEPRSEDLPVVFATVHDTLLSETAQAREDTGATTQAISHLLSAFHADLVEGTGERFIPALERALDASLALDGDVAAWQDIISALRRSVLPYLDHRVQRQAEDLISQARVLIGEVAQRAQAYRQLQQERQSAVLREIGQALITAFDVDALADVLVEQLPHIGIKSCYLALYENPAVSLEQSRLILAYTEQSRVPLEPGGRLFPSCELVPDGLLPQNRRYSMVVEPLYFREDQIGFILFEVGPRDGSIYEVLRGHISSALKGALLVHDARQARLAAEKADQIKTRLLANVSHELRMPLHIILKNTKDALKSSDRYGITLPQALLNDMQHIQNSAEHQLRLINDLLDLSRAEIDELDLHPELIDPWPLLEEAFHSLADRATASRSVTWKLYLPDRLPWIYADAVRLRQILLNLLSNAQKFTQSGHIALGADVAPPHLHIWVEDTGIGIPSAQHERIFEPFVTAEGLYEVQGSGIGLGLSITRQLVTLHSGTMEVDSQSGAGSTFHIYLPLPSLSDQRTSFPTQGRPVLLVISTSDHLIDEIVEFSQRQGLEIRRLRADDDVESILASIQPAAIAWDLVGASPSDWVTVRRLRSHPRWSQLPFILYGQGQADEPGLNMGLTSFVAKPTGEQTLIDVISASCPTRSTGPILIVDDDPSVRALHQNIVAQGLPGYPICVAEDGKAALAMMAEEVPSLVLLDLMMPGMEGTDVLERMRADPRLRQVPVVILSNKLLSLDDVKQLERHANVTLQSKGILSEDEFAVALNRALFGTDALPPHTSALAKRAIAYIQQNHARPLARWEIAEAVGVSEDYLSRVFSRELGLTPWDYLNRYRVARAKELLHSPENTVGSVAQKVGFKDQTYFSRVFRKVTGLSPQAYRETLE